MYDVWEEAALEATVEVVEEDLQLAEYEAWEETALAATVDAFVADERQLREAAAWVGGACAAAGGAGGAAASG
jgi:hypothetical protein